MAYVFPVRVFLVGVLSLCLLSVVACSSRPSAPPQQLEQRADYFEEVITNQAGLQLFARTWKPQGSAKANVVILHGTSLHGGVYADPARYLSAHGYRVFAFDMQSWGYSQGRKGCGYVADFDDYGQDLKQVLQLLRQRYPDVKNYVMGESLGGTVAMYGSVRFEFLLDGVITSGVGYKPSLKVMGIRAPEFVNDITMSSVKWFWSGFGSVPAVESDIGLRMAVEDQQLQDRLLSDPEVCHDWLPGAYLSTTLKAIDFIEPRLRHVTVPVLLLHGKDDILVPLSSSQEVYDEIDSVRKRMVVYDSPHAVLLEAKWQTALQDVVAFLDQVN
ncbi:MAG: alpha/beta fold hydrolase [Pseudomonadota bacterium]|nr:alpha/beta fold hydrolase [Pseudomonadota bacterium]